MMQRFMTLVVTTMTNGAGFKSRATVLHVVEQWSSEGKPLVAGGASIPPESAPGHA